MARYAANTTVSSGKSKAEIEKILYRYGAEEFISGWSKRTNTASVFFELEGKRIEFYLSLPDRDSDEFILTVKRKERSYDAAEKAWEQATRQRWRALKLVINAKLEAIESGISTVEQEFLNWILLPDGRSVGQSILPQIKKAYETGNAPKLLTFDTEQ